MYEALLQAILKISHNYINLRKCDTEIVVRVVFVLSLTRFSTHIFLAAPYTMQSAIQAPHILADQLFSTQFRRVYIHLATYPA